MSDLFMDMHRRRRRWHNHQNHPPTPPPSLAATLASTTTRSASTSSVQHTEQNNSFSHHSSQTDITDAAHNGNFINFDNQANEDQVSENGLNHEDNDDDDIFSNVLGLKLRKPKHWKWELTTSKSCSNIALPRILLYNHKGKLLVDAQDKGDGECVYREEDYERPKRDKTKKHTHYQQQQCQEREYENEREREREREQKPLPYQQRSATTNLTHSIRKALEKEFNGLQIQEATPSPEPSSQTSSYFHCSRKAVNLNTTDLPDYSLSRRSSSLKGVRFIVKDDNDYLQSQIPDFLPTPPSTTTTPTSSSSGPRQKRKYRRSQSSGRSSANSESILERFSYQKGRFSSPEFAEEQEIHHGPRYFLRTSKAGTLVVQEDSFSKHPLRRRRRPLKNRSTESLQKSSASSMPSAQQQSANNSPISSEFVSRRHKPIHRRITDGNILLHKQSLSSDEDGVAVGIEQKHLMDNVSSTRHLRKYAEARHHAKADINYSPDVEKNGKVR